MKQVFMTLVAVLAISGMGRAHGEPITYTEFGKVKVSENGVTYTSRNVTLTGTADTASVIGPGTLPGSTDSGYYVALTNATITVAGTTTAFADTIAVVDDTTTGTFEFVDVTAGNLTMLGQTQMTPFGTYDLTTSIGPITGGTDSTDGSKTKYNLVGGGYVQFESPVINGTVKAVVVPEPSSIVLAGLAGLTGLGFHRARVWRAAKRS